MPTPVNTSGGNSPVQQAAVQNMRGGATASTPPTQAPVPGGAPGPAGGASPLQGQGGEVATLLAQAFDALLKTGPTPQNLAALEGFWRMVSGLNPAGSNPQAPLGQAPGNAPMPPTPAPSGIAGMGSPMVPPRQV